MSRASQQPDPLNQVLNGRPAAFVPVAPVYEGLGALEFHRMEVRWRKWRDKLDAAGTDLLPVDYHSYFGLELEIHTDILDSCYPPPAWLAVPGISVPSEVAGCAVARRGEELFWLNADGQASWIPPNRREYQEAMAAEKSHRFAGLWTEGYRSTSFRKAASRAAHELRPTPEPDAAQAEALLESGRYDVARALLSRYPKSLPLYTTASSPYNSLLGVLGFQGMMSALVDSPGFVHELLEDLLPTPSVPLAAERALGAGIAFVEECLASADIISPRMYMEFSFPYTRQLLEFYEERGFRTVLYFSGNLMPLLGYLKDLPFTALSFEEDRKGYGIDLGEVRRSLGPERVLFGNVDAHFLEKASDAEVLDEVRRQIEVAGKEGNFVVSVGSPFTPGTTLDRVKLFCESTRMI